MAKTHEGASEVGGELIADNASEAAKDFIVTARAMMYDDRAEEAVKKALTGTAALADGIVPFLAMTIQGIEGKQGELSDMDRQVVAIHLAGSMVDLAKELGDPDADKPGLAQEIAGRVMEMLAKNPQGGNGGQGGAPMQPGPGGPPPDPNAPDPNAPPPGPQPRPLLQAPLAPQ